MKKKVYLSKKERIKFHAFLGLLAIGLVAMYVQKLNYGNS